MPIHIHTNNYEYIRILFDSVTQCIYYRVVLISI